MHECRVDWYSAGGIGGAEKDNDDVEPDDVDVEDDSDDDVDDDIDDDSDDTEDKDPPVEDIVPGGGPRKKRIWEMISRGRGGEGVVRWLLLGVLISFMMFFLPLV